jgi:hypothetical protein
MIHGRPEHQSNFQKIKQAKEGLEIKNNNNNNNNNNNKYKTTLTLVGQSLIAS